MRDLMAEERVIASKLVNALVREARLEPAAVANSGGAAEIGPEQLMRMFGGFQGGWWVGGRVTLTRGHLRFAAHALNRIVRAGPMEVDLDLRRVLGVGLRPGLVLDVVTLTLPGAELWLQCVGAEKFADLLDEQVRSARSGR